VLLLAWRQELASKKELAEAALAQLEEHEIHRTIAHGTNSVAALFNHLGGNLNSRFTDFLTTDGEKPWRDRDAEFASVPQDRGEILVRWQMGWSRLLQTLDHLRPEHLSQEVTIRGEPHTVPRALERAVGHVAYHTGQIVLIARIIRGEKWRVLTVPPGGTAALNDAMAERFGAF
jgi:uncharacterized damage-inducible protein DinB